VYVGLREEQRELTRRMVLGAVLDLVAEGTLDEVSVPAVARRSGVSVATIYRYFPSKDDLLAAAAAEPSRIALTSTDRPAAQPGDDEFAMFLRAMWHEFAGNLPLLRHQISSEAGREMRRARFADGRVRLAAYVEEFGVDPTSAEGERLISLIMLISGSIALVELHDRQGMDVDDAIDASLWAVHALIDTTNPDRTVPDGETTT
jgi:AcrR family transcriptional regulator